MWPRIISMCAFILFAPLLGGLIDGLDRVLTARMQGRKGPSVLQAFYDLSKLTRKEFMAVSKFQLLMVLSYLFFNIFSGALFYGGFDILIIIFSLTTGAMFLILASTSTNSPFATLGSHREMMQMMSYEPMILLMAVGLYLASGSFSVSEIVKAEIPAIVYAPGFFLGFLFVLTIKFRKSPFDLSTAHHAHQEVVKGVTVEMVGVEYAVTNLAEWYENVLLLSFVGLFFITKDPISILWAALAAFAVFFLEILLDNTFARVKWTTMFQLSWAVTLITGGLNLLILELLHT